MILFYPPTRKALHVPPFIGEVYSRDLVELPGGESIRKNYLVLRHPLDWVETVHAITCPAIPIKLWFNAGPPRAQSIVLPTPDWVIRAEDFKQEMLTHFGIEASIVLAPLPRSKTCRRLAEQIQRTYSKDFSLGSYKEVYRDATVGKDANSPY